MQKLLFLFSLLLPLASVPAAAAATGPNVVIVITDDQGYGDLGVAGNPVVETPRLDRLAGESVWLTDFQVAPLCAPTRAALLTGRYPLRSGVTGVSGGAENMDADEVTLAELFRAAGYRTAAFGKWHNGQAWPHHPNANGFEDFAGFCSGHWGNYFDTTIQRNGKPFPTKGYLTDVLTDLCIDFIAESGDQPFFLWFGVNTPHSPWQAPEPLYKKYRALGLDPYRATCYAMIENIDANVGRILDQLEASGVAKNTLFIFLSDNGPNGERFNAGWRDHKGRFYEGGTRVPFFFRWPARFEGGLRTDALAAHIDLLPTLAELCDLDLSRVKPLDGRSLVPVLEGEVDQFPERELFIHDAFGRADGKAAVRTERFRAVRMQPDTWELYDIATDPSERVDLADAFQDRTRSMAKAYAASFKEVTDHGALTHPTELGHEEWPVVEFPAHESRLFGRVGEGIGFEGTHGWSHDWVSGWTDTNSGILWPVRVVADGTYDVKLVYAATGDQRGAELKLSMGEGSLRFSVDEINKPRILPNPDTHHRKEADNVIWGELSVGTIDLKAGGGELRLSAEKIPGPSAPWIKGLRLRRIPSPGKYRFERSSENASRFERNRFNPPLRAGRRRCRTVRCLVRKRRGRAIEAFPHCR